MSIPQVFWTQVQERVQTLFQEIGKQVNKVHPGSVVTIGYGHNEIFPFRAFVTFVAEQYSQREAIDISIDCKLSNHDLLIGTDIAREQGFILAETPLIQVSIDGADVESQITAAFNQIEAFLKSQIDLICNELGDVMS